MDQGCKKLARCFPVSGGVDKGAGRNEVVILVMALVCYGESLALSVSLVEGC